MANSTISSIGRFHLTKWKARVNPVMHRPATRQDHKVGDNGEPVRLYIDFAGFKRSIVDKETGELTELEVLVAILGAGQLTYVEAVGSQQKEDLIAARENALYYIGGVPAAIVPVPVFAVKGYTDLKSINNIVFPCNLKLEESDVISKVKELQKPFHSHIHLLRINTGKSMDNIKINDKLQEYASHHQLSKCTTTVLDEANIKDGILHFAREVNADMIAMVTHVKRDIHHMFSESLTADIVNHANILVWTCSS